MTDHLPNLWQKKIRLSREGGKPDLYSWIPARASYRQLGRNDDAVVFGNPTHRPDLRPGFAKDDDRECAKSERTRETSVDTLGAGGQGNRQK